MTAKTLCSMLVVRSLVAVLVPAAVLAQTGSAFVPSAGLPFATTTAQTESGDTGVALVSIAWTKYRSDSISPGVFDTSATGTMPVWDYTFLSPTQGMLYEYTITLRGSQYQVLQRRQRPQDTARPINRSWYDIDSVLTFLSLYDNNTVKNWKSRCPELEVALVRLCLIREPYLYRTYIPMWIIEFWCPPQRLKNQAIVDAMNRAVVIFNDSLELTSSIPYQKPDIPITDHLVLTGSSIHISPPLTTESTIRIFNIIGRVVSEQILSAGSTSIPFPPDLPRGTYCILILDSTGSLLRSLYLVRPE